MQRNAAMPCAGFAPPSPPVVPEQAMLGTSALFLIHHHMSNLETCVALHAVQ